MNLLAIIFMKTKPEMLITAAMIRENEMRSRLENARSQMQIHIESVQREMDKISEALAIKYTGLQALLKKTDDGWKCVRIVDANNLPDDLEDDFDVLMPIPEPDSVPEFTGW